MDGFKLNSVSDVYVGGTLAKQVYVGSTKIWDYKTPPVYTAPTVKNGLVYNGSAQVLLNAGSTDHGTIQYSSDGKSWGTALPTSTNANASITVYWRLVGDGRHNDIPSTPLTTSIAQREVTLSWGTTSWTYDKTAHSTTCTAGNLVSGDTCTVNLTGNSITNKGTTTVTASGLSNSNYKLPSSKTTTLTINARVVTLSWGDLTWTYDGSEHLTTCTAGNVCSGDTCTVTLTGNSITNKGTTIVTASSLSNSNYALPSSKTATLTVNAKTVTLNWGTTSWTYNKASHSTTCTASGLVGSDTCTVTLTGNSIGPNVGSTTVTASSLSNSNYALPSANTKTISIVAKEVSLNWGDLTWTYDKTEHSTTCTAGGLISGDTCTVTLTGNSITNKGTATVTASSLSNSNYKLPSNKTATLTVNARVVTLSWGTLSWTYDKESHGTTCTAGNVCSGDTCTVTLTGNSITNVGSTTVTASALSNSNYALPSSKTATISIVEREVTLSWGTLSWTYDGSAHSTTCTAGNLCSGDTCTVTLTGNSITNKGTTTVTASSLSNSNYKLPTANTNTLTITAKVASLNWGTISWVYDASAHSTTCTVNNLESGDTCTVTLTGNSITNKGTATVTASSLSNSNYALPSSKTNTLTITARPINVTAGSTSKTYDGTALTYNSATAESTGTNRGLVSGHSMTSCTVTGTITNKGSVDNVPSAAVIKSGSTDVTSNYSITYVKGTLTINAATLTITASDQSIVYGNSIATGVSKVTTSGLVSGDSLTSITLTPSASTVTTTGTITPSAGATTNGINNYTVSYKTGKLTITARPINITASSASKTYDGTALTSNSATAESTGTNRGIVSGHTMTCTVTGTITNKGSVDNIASGAVIKSGTTDVTSNYSITYVKGTLTINAKALTITAKDQSVTYGTAITTGTGQVTVSGLVSGDSLTAITLTASRSTVGSGTITPSAGTTTKGISNYSVTYKAGTLTVTEKALTIIAKAQTIQWGNSIATGTGQVTVSGLISGDSLTGIILTPSTSDLTTTGTITPSAATTTNGASNYSITYNTGTLTVTQRAITITAKAQSVTYGTAITTGTGQVTISGSGLVSEHSLTSISLAASRTSVGSGTITPSAAVIKNGTTDMTSKYAITYNTGSLTVTAKALTITAKNQSISFGDSIATGTGQVTVSGLVSGDSLTGVTLTASTTAVTTTGTITPSAATTTNGAGNYSITYNTGTLTISKRAITITAKNQSVTFGTAISTGTGQVTTSSLGRLTLSSITLAQSTTNVTTTGTITLSAAVIKDGTTDVTSSCTLTYNTGALTITAKALTITAKAQTIDYGSSIATGTSQVTVSGLISGDSLTAVTLTASTANVPGGTITPSAATCTKGISNYSVTYNTGTLTINKVNPTYTAPAATNPTYNGSAQYLITIGSTNHGTIKYSSDGSTWSTTRPQGTNATSYDVYWKLDGDGNHNSISSTKITSTIAKVTPTVTAPTAKVLTYNGSAQTLSNAGSTNFGTLKYRIGTSGDWSTSVPTATNHTASGYALYYKVDGDSNVNSVAAAGPVTCNINEKSVTATVTLSQSSYTYNGSACTPTVTVKDGTTVIPSSEYTVTYSNNVNAGTATVTVSDNTDGNYDVTGSTTFTIAQREVTLTWGTLTWTYDKSAHSTTCTAGNLVSGDTCTVTLTGNSITNKGTATVTASSLSNSNYKLPSSKTATLTINARTVTLNWGTLAWTYDGSEHSTTCTAGNVCSGDTCTVTLTGNSITNAGTATVTASSLSNSNYALPSSKTATLTINAKTVTLNWGTTSWTYDKSSHSTTCTAGSLISGDSCTVTLTGNSIGPNVGSTTVTASELSNSNYVLPSSNTKTISIVQREVTLTWGDLTWTYNAAAHSTSCTAGNLCSGDTCTVTLTGNSITNKGTATVTASSLSNSNYKLPSTKTATLTINAKAVTYTATNESWTYDKESHSAANTASITAGGLVSGHTATITCTGSITNVGSTTKTLSSVVIKNSGGTDVSSNYSITKNNGTLTINAREVTLNWGTASWTYDKTEHSTTCTAGNVCSGDTCTVTLTGNSVGPDVGSATVTASSLSNSNYKLPSSKTKTISITARTITLNWGTITWVYDASAHSTTCTAGNVVSGDTCTVSLNGNSITNKGTTTVTAASLSNSNYALPSSKTNTLTISARPINVTAGSTSKTYDGTALTYDNATAESTGTNRGLVSGHSMTSCTVTGTITDAGSVNNVPSAAVIKSGTTEVTSNYNISYVNGTLTVNKYTPTVTLSVTNRAYNGNALYATATVSKPTNGATIKGTIYYGTSSGAQTYNVTYNGSGSVNLSSVSVTNVGSATVYAYFVPDSSCNGVYNNSGNASKTFSVSKADQSAPTASATAATYPGTSTASATGGGNQGSIEWSNGNSRTSVGTQATKARWSGNSNYNASPYSNEVTLSVSKFTPVVTLSATDRAYNGNALYATASIATPSGGATMKGTIYYGTSSGSQTYNVTYSGSGSVNLSSVSVTNVGSATVYAYFVPDSTCSGVYNNSGNVSKTFSVSRANISPTVSLSNWTYGNTANNPSVTGNSGSGTVTYNYKVQGAADSTYTATKPSNAGSYTVRAQIAQTTNYNAGTATANFTIAQREVTLTWGTTSWTYDKATHTTTCTAGNLVSGDTCIVTLTGNSVGANVGSATVTASGLSNNNYKLPSANTKSISIVQREVTLNWGTLSWTYDGSAHTTTCTAGNLCSGDTCTVTLSGNSVGANVGTATVTASSLSNSNYKLPSTKTATLTVSAKVVTLNWGTISWTYNKTAHSTTCTASGLVGSDTCTVTLSGNSITNVGTTTVTASALSNSNYALPSGKTNTLTITAREVTLTWGDLTWTYDGTAHSTTCTAGNLCSGDTCTVTLTGNSITNKGTTTVTASSLSNSNYKLPSSKTATLTVNAKTITLNWGTTSWTYDGSTHSTSCTAGSLISGDTCTVTLTGNTVGPNVGSATVTASSLSNSNYALPLSNTKSISIVAKEVSLKWGTITWVYDGADHGTTCVAESLVSGDTCTVTLSGNSITSKGTTTVTASSLSNSNYKLPSSKTNTLTISARPINVTAGSTSKTYDGTALTYNSATAESTGTNRGLVSGHSMTSCTVTGTITSAGTANNVPSAATIKSGTLDVTSNYSITYVNGTLTVNKYTPTVTLSATNRAYNGNALYASATVSKPTNGTAVKGTIYYGTSSGSQTYNVAYSGSAVNLSSVSQTNVGSITVYAYFVPDSTCSGVYNNSGNVSKTLTISKATGSGSVTMSGWTYGGTVTNPTPTSSTNPTTGVTYTWYNSSKTALSSKPTSTSSAGTYYVKATFPAGDNYNAYTTDYVSFTIAQREVTLSWGTTSWTYDKASHSTTCTAGNLVSGDTCTVTLTGNTVGVNVGSTTVTASSLSNSNYKLPSANTKTISIVAKEVSLTWGTLTWTYDKTAHSTTCTAGNLVSGDTCTVTLTGNSITNKGTATVTASSLSNSNYKLPSSKTATLTINARTVTLSWGDLTWTYDKTAHSTTCTAGNLCSGDTCTVTLTGNSITNVGSTTVTASSLSNSNYALPSSKTNTLTITAREVTLTWGTLSWTYDDTAHSTTCTAGNLCSGDTCTVTLTGNSITNKGTTTVTASTLSNSNYKLPAANTNTLTISAKAVTYTATNESWTYDGSAHSAANTATITSGGLVSGHTATITCTGSITNAGTATKTLSSVVIKNSGGTDVSSNYSITKKNGTLTVSQKALTITAKNQTIIYSNSIATGTSQVTTSGLVSGDSLTSITLTPSRTDAGTGTITPSDAATTKGIGNYSVTYNTGTLTINKVTPTVTAPTAKVLTYNGSAQTLANAGSTNFGTLKYKLGSTGTASTSVPSATDHSASGYTIYYWVEGNSNVNDVAEASITCNINEKPVTATVTLSSTSYTYSGSANQPTVTVKDGTTVIDPSEYTVTYSNNINAGTGTVTISDNADGNYNVTGSATFTISAKALTITAKAQTIQWGNSISTGTGQVTTSGLVSGDSLTGVTLTPSTSDLTTTGTITPSAATTTKGAGNYSITYNTGTLTVNKRSITITAKAQSVTFGTAITTGTGQVTISGSGLASSNSLNSISLAASRTDVGSGTITPSSAVIKNGTTDVTTKYSITYNTGTLTISAKALTITAKAQTISFGDSIATGTGQVTVSGLISGDSLTAVTLTPSTSAVTTSGTITPSAATCTKGIGNYSVTYNTGSLTISKREITITAKAQTVTYGTAITQGVGQVTTTSLGRLTLYSISLAQSTTNVTTTGTITPSAAVIKDGTTDVTSSCTLSYVTGTLTINAKSISIPTPTGASKVYNASASTGTFGSATGASITKYRYSTDGSSWTESSSNPSLTAKGTLYTQAYYTASSNYTGSGWSSSATITISARPINVTAGSTSKTYDGTALTYNNATAETTGTNRGLVNGHSMTSCTVTGTVTNPGSANNVPSSAVIKSGTTDVTTNYSISYVNGTLTVSKYTPTVTLSCTDRAYNGNALYATATVSKPTSGAAIKGTIYYGTSSGSQTYNVAYSGSAVNLSSVSVTNVGSATVYAYFVPDSTCNTYYNNSGNVSKTFTISRANISPTVSLSGWTYGNTANNPSVSGNSGSGTVTYNYKVQGANDSTYTATKPSTAGSYTVRAQIAQTTNYNAGTATANFTIAQREVTLSWGTVSWTYDGSAHSTSCTAGNVISGDTCTVTLTDNFVGPNVGSVTVTASSLSNSNYKLPSSKTKSISITAKEVALNWGTTSWTYDKTAHSTTCTATGLISGDTCTVNLTGNSITNKGTTTVTASSLSNSNYALPSGKTATLTVTAREVTLSWGTTSWTYDGSAHSTTCTAGNLCSGDSCTVTLTGNSITHKGSTTVTASALSNSNYKLPSSNTKSISISAKSITLTWGTLTWTYDKSAHSTTCTISSGLVGSDTCNVTLTGNSVGASVGTATVTASLSNSDYTPSNGTATLTINKREVTLTWGTITWTYDASSHSTTCTAGNVCSGDTCTVTLTGNSIGPNVGTGTVTASSLSNSNYKLPSSNTKTLTISAKAVAFSAKAETYTYDKLEHVASNTGEIISGSLVSGHTATYTCTGSITNAGSTSKVLSSVVIKNSGGTDVSSNYNITKTDSSIIINQREVTLTWGTASWTYNGSSHSTTCTAGNLCSGDTCTVTLTNNSVGPNVGSATVTASSLSNSNYKLPSSKTKTISITAKEVTLNWGTTSWTYDKATHSTTCTASGLISGDSCSVTLTGNSVGANVGSATVTASSLSNSNYKLPSANTKSISIVAKEVSLTWGDLTWTYDGSAHGTTCTAGNLCSGDTCTVTLTGNSITNKGTTTVTASSLSNSNYKLPSGKTNTLTINAKTVGLSWGTTSWTYDKATHSTTCTATGLVGSDSCTVTLTGNSVGPDVGSATVTASSLSNSNYALPSSKTKTISITAKTVSLNWGTITWVYDASAHSTTCTAGSLVSGDSCSVTLTGNSITNKGTTTVTASSLSNSNYALPSSKTNTLTINARPINVTASSSSKTYDGTALTSNSATAETTGTNRGLVNGHSMTSCTVTGTITNAGSVNNVPSAAVIKSGTTEVTSNYSITYVNGTLTVSKYTPTVTLSATNRAYNGNALYATATVSKPTNGATIKGTIYYGTSSGAQTYSVTYSGSGSVNLSSVSVTNVGSATVYAYFVPDSTCNGVYNNSGNVSKTFTVSKANGSGSVTMSGWTYGGTVTNPTPSSSTNPTTGVTYTWYNSSKTALSSKPASTSSAGTYYVKATFPAGDNYNAYTTDYVSFTIAQREVTLTWGTASWTYDGSAHSTSCTAGNLVSGDTCTVTLTGNSVGPNVGSATVTASSLSNSNYKLPSSKTKSISITAKTVTLNWGTLTWIYDKTAHSTTCTATGLVGSDTCTVTLTGNSITNKGTTTVTASSLSNSNYALPTTKTATLTINAREVTLTWGTITWTYDASAHSTTCTAGNLCSGDTCTVTLTGNSITNKGTTTVTASSLSNSNYKLPAANTNTLTISAKAVTYTATNESWTYNGSAHSAANTATITSGGLVSDHTATITCTGSITNVGTATKTLSSVVIKNSGGTDVSSNYSITKKNGTLTVTAKALTITAKNQTITYSNSIATGTAQVTTSGLVSGDSLTSITLTPSRTDAGTGTITPSEGATTKGIGNYSVTYNTGTLTINKVTPTVTAPTAKVLTYNGSAQVLANAGSTNFGTLKYKLGSTGTASTSVPSATNHSSSGYTVYYWVEGNSNVNDVAEASITCNINEKPVTATVTLSQSSYTYSGSANQPTVTVKDGSTVIDSSEYTVTYSNNVNVGTGTVTISDKTDGNYNVTGSATFTITAKALTVTAKAQTIQWGNSIATGTGQVTVSGLVSGDSLTGVTLTPSTSDLTTTGTITPSAATTTKGAGNYSITYSTGTLTINKRAITITAKAQSVTYGTAITTGTGQVTISGSGLASNNSLNSISLAASRTTVGTGTITPSSAVIKNGTTDLTSKYTITYNTGTLTVTAKALTVTAKNQSISFGDSIATGTGQVTVSGLISGDSLTGVTLTASTTAVTTSGTITPSAATCTNGIGNYSVTYNTGTLTISKRSITITAKAQTVTYGTAITQSTNQVTTTSLGRLTLYSISLAQSTTNVTTTGTITPSSAVIKDGSTDVTSSCTISYVTGTLTINAKTVSLNWGTITWVYDGSAHGTTCTAGGVVSGDTCTVNLTGNSITTKGTTTVTASSLSNSNYALPSSKTNTLTISARPIKVTAGSTSKAYDGTALTYNSATAESTGTNRGLASGHSMTSCTVTGTVTNPGSVNNVPSAAVIKSGTTEVTSNYSISYVNGTLTVSKYTPTVTLSATNRAYNGNALFATATVSKPTSGAAIKGTIYYGTTSGAQTYSVTYSGSSVNLSSVSVTNVGSATVYAYFVPDSTCNTYYNNSGNASKTFSVSRANISPTVSLSNWTYGNTANNPSVSGNSGSGSVTYNYKVQGANDSTYSATKPSTAGSYTVRAQIAQTTNYNAGTATANFTIAQREVTLSWGTASWTYDKASHTTTCTAGNLVSGDTCTVTLTGNSVGPNVGSATVTASSLSNSNYKLPSSKTKSISITAKTVTLNWGTTSWTYDKASHTTTCTATGLISGDTCTVTLSDNSVGPDVGSATVTASALSNSNYALPSANTKSISIVQREVTLSWGTTSWTYDKSTHSTTCTAGNLCSGDTCTVTLTGNSVGANVGTATVTASSLSNSNYKLPSSKTKSISIVAKAVSLTWGTLTWTYDAASHTTTCTAGSLCSGDTCTVTLSGNSVGPGVGTATVTASSLSNSNYKLPSTKTATLTINAKAVTYTATNESWTYDKSAHSAANTATITAGSLVSGHTATITCSGSITNAGSATKTLSSVVIKDSSNNDVSSNYSITKNNGTLTVNAKEVTLSWGTVTWTYDGSAHTTTCTAGSLCSGDTCTVTLTGNSVGPSVGTATVTASSLSNSNYKLPSTKTKTLTINAKTVTLNWGTTSWTYDKSSHSTTCTASGLVGSDTCTVTLTGNSVGANVGSATVTASSLSNSNYTLPSSKTKTISITAKTVSLNWGTITWVYDGSAHSTTCTAGSLISGDTCTVTLTGNSITNKGTTTVTASSLSNSNYALPSSKTNTLTISARPINVTASSASKTYNGTALTSNSATAESTGTNRGLVSGHSMTSCTVTGTITNAGTANNVPSAAVIKSGSTDVTSNYSITYVNGTLTVNKANRSSFAVSMNGWTYGGTATNPSVSGNTESGTVTYQYKISGGTYSSTKPTSTSTAGTYYVKATAAATTNYNASTAESTFVISKANISPTVSMSDWVYGETAQSPSVSGNTGNGSVTYTYLYPGDSQYSINTPVSKSDIGTYTVKATIGATTNYNGKTVTNTFSILTNFIPSGSDAYITSDGKYYTVKTS